MESEITDMAMFEDNMSNVFVGMLRRAVADYNRALKKKKKRLVEKLEDFFYSDYCEQILDFIEFNKDVFYEKLGRLERKYI